MKTELQKDITLTPVGIIRNRVVKPQLVASKDGLKMNGNYDSTMKKLHDDSYADSEILIRNDMADLLDGIEDYSHIIVLYWGHEITDDGRSLKKVHPAGRNDYQLEGIFSTCSPARPNPVLMTVVRLLKKEKCRLLVSGLDAIDKSPVIDLKPYVCGQFPQKETFVPRWMESMMKEFNESNTMKETDVKNPDQMFCSRVLDNSRIEKLKENPRAEFGEAVKNKDVQTCLIKTAEIHGHYCPGSALGVMASIYGLHLLGPECMNSDGVMENLLAIVEINACFADGVQAVSGCTLGNNALIYRDLGKLAVTFAVRGKKEGVRIRARPEFKEYVDENVPEFYPMMEKVIMKRDGTAEEEKLFRKNGLKAAFSLSQLPFEKLFSAETVIPDIPDYAPISASAFCPKCGEMVMASKIIKDTGECLMCSGKYREVEGRGIVEKEASKQ
ncbi:tRNA-Thr(GGU) m(6)t(6)A37 methyltransferase TsaA [Methanomicrobium sp. W14]|uniref:TrmO family methyltransferase domain-containing protein n=1 Tax=Methanomicrobium sp. W14 TaxID=2817839 RepID=UPI001FDA7F81|nr:TrmO family methyltransferase [Methanomicrobium sp. W14]MBP2133077.1 tRNA-Thr(GGU) m(6)t(6)A37 methyltransferase TsaA [Methanomicrobium sp. W14]